MVKFFEKISVVLLAALLVISLTAYIPAYAMDFPDMTIGDRNYVAITNLTDQGIISGYEDGTFKPSQKVSRAEATKMLLKAVGDFTEPEPQTETQSPSPSPSSSQSQPQSLSPLSFTDIQSSHWATQYITEALKRDIVSGYEDGTFKPDDPINLAEALKMLCKTIENYSGIEVTEDPFADAPKDSWFAEYALYAKTRTLLYINSENKIDPNQELTRGYLAEILYRLQKFTDGYTFGKATFYGEAFDGRGTASGEKFDMTAMTAAHKTLPFGTMVEVTNLANDKTVQVKITDRGPYGPGRELDLSESAFTSIANRSQGVINIQYKIITPQ